jgi:hypothetical protein
MQIIINLKIMDGPACCNGYSFTTKQNCPTNLPFILFNWSLINLKSFLLNMLKDFFGFLEMQLLLRTEKIINNNILV